MKRTLLLISASLGLLLAVATAFACTCALAPPPKEALGQATAVFSGTVVEISPSSHEVTMGGQRRMVAMKRVTFRVTEIWKGTNMASQIVYTGVGGGDCGYYFVQGSNYLVYAYQTRESEVLTTDICTRTRDTSLAANDLRVLGVGEKPKVK